jgi:membrane-associated protein
MEMLSFVIHFILHLDESLLSFVTQYGNLTYCLLFMIIFCETGLVVTPFLPGDSLLFAAGTLAAAGALNVWILSMALFVAAVLGNTVNYAVGFWFGGYFSTGRGARFLKREYLEKTHAFYEKYGAKTIVITRFVPIARTIAPFVAGLGKMPYRTFCIYNFLGAFLWIGILVGGSYSLGNLPFVRENFSAVIFAVIILSITPAIFEVVRVRFSKKLS